jgi:hypothetical protein
MVEFAAVDAAAKYINPDNDPNKTNPGTQGDRLH